MSVSAGCEAAQYQSGIDTHVAARPAAVMTASPPAKPITDVTPSQAMSFQVCGSELSIRR